jgi:tetratricopeptide (TPR) repeat protein
MELAQYALAESGYGEVLDRLDDEDPQRTVLTENLAAAIYKQGELANEAEQPELAAEHFLRIAQVAPASSIRPAAEYDAAVALIKLEQWTRAAEVLRAFRADHAEHELQSEVTKQLAFVYQKAGELAQSADEFLRVAAQAEDPALRAESLLQAGTLYQQAGRVDAALAAYEEYAQAFPEPLETNVETRYTIAQLHRERRDEAAHHEVLRDIVALDRNAGAARTDRVRYLAAQSALVLAQPAYEHFASMTLQLPMQESLAEKQRRMDASLQVFEALPDYQVGEVTAAATYYMAEIYQNFSDALLESQRPAGLTDEERAEYDLMLEEEAYPFEERAIEVHEANIDLARAGAYSTWVERSLEQLAHLVPGQYARAELSAGFLPEIARYAYRSPLADLEEETMTAEAQTDRLLEVSHAH